MSILGIDYGAKKIGLAKSDKEQTMALPLEVLTNKTRSELLIRLNEICQEHDVFKIVVGVPVSLSRGSSQVLLREVANKQMQEVLEFIEWLKKHIHLPIEMEDERLSTKMANGLMKGTAKGKADDAVAAMLILQTYLDKQK